MPATTTKTAFWRGFVLGAPFVLVTSPFGMLFGVVATEAGLNLTEVMAFSFMVIAGAAQFTAIHLMTENAPTIIIVVTALAVNMRMAMYSASISPYFKGSSIWGRMLIAYGLVDQSYALSHAEFDSHPTMTMREKNAFFIGTISLNFPLWYISTYVGAVVGTRIPPEFALDFAAPITFLSMVAPALKSPAHVAAAFTSVICALVFMAVPYSLGLMIASIIAMCVGAGVEIAMERRAA